VSPGALLRAIYGMVVPIKYEEAQRGLDGGIRFGELQSAYDEHETSLGISTSTHG
jgi:hypothetical protein